MSRHIFIVLYLLAVASNAAHAQDAAAAQSATNAQRPIAQADAGEKRPAADGKDQTDASAAAAEVKTLSGISILGNQEAPKSLVIVPWKGSEIGDMPGLSRLLDDSVQPIDKEVFMRELDYYEIRSNSQ